MDVRRALTYLFEDPHWPRKLGIAMLLNLLPAALNGYRQLQNAGNLGGDLLATVLVSAVLGLASIPIYGYVLRITRNVVAGADVPLPEWAGAPRLLRDGLELWGVIVLWGLPAALIGLPVVPLSGDSAPAPALLVTFLISLIAFVVLVVQPAAEARLSARAAHSSGSPGTPRAERRILATSSPSP